MTQSLDRISANEARSIDNRKAIAELREAIEADKVRAEADKVRAEAHLAAVREEIKADRARTEAHLAAVREELAAQREELAAHKERFEAERLELRTAVNFLIQTTEQHQKNFEVMVTQIVGLQRENKRILEHLFGQEENGGS